MYMKEKTWVGEREESAKNRNTIGSRGIGPGCAEFLKYILDK